MLTDANIPHILCKAVDGWQIFYPNQENVVADAIEFSGSYGCFQNLIEIMGLLKPEEENCDSVLGYLTAEDVFERMSKHYEEYCRHYDQKGRRGEMKIPKYVQKLIDRTYR